MRLRLRRLVPALMIAVALTGAASVAAAPVSAQPPPPPPPVVGCQAAYQIDAAWAGGFMASVTITNTGNVPVTWQVEVTFSASDLTQGWNGIITIAPMAGVIDPPAWLPALPPGGSHQVGMVGTGDGAPSGVTITCVA